MPLHKSSSRASRLDPTMISAPLDDFRHTMHIGRGGDAFGDTSFLSTHGPGNNTTGSGSDLGAPGSTVAADSQMPNISHDENGGSTDSMEASEYTDLSRDHSESVSSFTLDLDLGPSILGDVLGVMDGLGLDSTNEEDVFTSSNNATLAEMKSGRGEPKDLSVCAQNEFNGKEPVEMEETQTRDHKDGTPAVGNWSKAKGLRPKVRFSDKREEIIRQASEEEEGQGFTFEEDGEHSPQTPTEGQKGSYAGGAGEAESTTLRADIPPSPASSHSSDNNGSSPLHCRLVETSHFETDSDDEEEEETGDCGRGYTFEDEFDDEIGL